MSRIVPATVVALMAGLVIPSSVSAAEQYRDGLRNSHQIEVSSARRHHKRSARHVAADRGFYDEPYAGHRTDFAGNSYFYYRVGGDTPFGPGRGLRAPYPR